MTESSDDGPQRNATRLASPTARAGDFMSEASDKSIVYYLRCGAAPIDTASPAPGLIEHHQGASGPTSTAETSDKAPTAKHRARNDVLDSIAAARASGFEIVVDPKLAEWGRSTMGHCGKPLAMTGGISATSNETLASAIEDGRFDFERFGRRMKKYCLNYKDPVVNYLGKTGSSIYYMSAKILASAVEDESSNFERFGTEMTLLCLTSPTADVLPPAVEADGSTEFVASL